VPYRVVWVTVAAAGPGKYITQPTRTKTLAAVIGEPPDTAAAYAAVKSPSSGCAARSEGACSRFGCET